MKMLEKQTFPNCVYETWKDRETVINVIKKLEEEKKEALDFGIIYKGARINQDVLKRMRVCKGVLTECFDADYKTFYLTEKEFEEVEVAFYENVKKHETYFHVLVEWLSTTNRIDLAEKVYYGYSNDVIIQNYKSWREER